MAGMALVECACVCTGPVQNYCKIETSLKSINNATKSKTHQNAHFGTHASTGCEGKFKNSKPTPVAAAPE
jgi:hypothetical protein